MVTNLPNNPTTQQPNNPTTQQPNNPTTQQPTLSKLTLSALFLLLLLFVSSSTSYGQCPTDGNQTLGGTISNGFNINTTLFSFNQPVSTATNNRCWTTLAGTPPLHINVYDGNGNFRIASTSTLNTNGTTTTCVNDINSIPNSPLTFDMFFVVTFVVTNPTTGVVDLCNTTYNGGNGIGIINNLTAAPPLSVNFVRVGIESDCTTSTLIWHVSDEINVARYQIERSDDGEQFEPIGSVKATGAAQYRYTERSTRAAYYRIAEYETTGERGNSTAILYKKSCQNATLQVYPNPATDGITLVGSGAVQISNLLGQVVLSDTITDTKRIDVSALPRGLYLVKNNDTTTKLVVE